jgi:ketosteroid isomerase-like protein
MNHHKELINKFYTAFSNSDFKEMASCYHQNIIFEDPAFGILNGESANKMWQMLIERSKGNIQITFSDVIADEFSGSAKWIATYNFTQTNRKVVNIIDAKFEFRDGLIIKHTDYFDLYKWSKQALGWKGFLLGWTNFMKNKIRKTAQKSLKIYMKK